MESGGELNKKMQKRLYGLDVGSGRLALATGIVLPDGRIEEVSVETFASKGIHKGVVSDLSGLSRAIGELFSRMEKKTRHRATHVSVGVNGNYVAGKNSFSAMALCETGMRSVTKRDLERLMKQARLLGLELDESLLHEFVQGYSIDRRNRTLAPLGLHGRKIDLDLYLLYAPSSEIENLTKAFSQAGLDVSGVAFSGYACARAVSVMEEREQGCFVADVGDSLTTLVFIKDNILRGASVIPFGGRVLAQAISEKCGISLSLAREILESSLDISAEGSGSEEIMVRADDTYRPIRAQEVIDAVIPELGKFNDVLKTQMLRLKKDYMESSYGMISTGGLSLLEGFLEKMEQAIEVPVRLGSVRGLGDVTVSRSPLWACSLGLLILQSEEHLANGFGQAAPQKNAFHRLRDSVVHLYQDYF